MNAFDATKIFKTLPLGDGSRIVMLDMLSAPASVPREEVEQNTFRLSEAGGILWQIHAEPPLTPQSPFVNIGLDENGRLLGWRWDGMLHVVDIASGKATPHAFVK